jgi:PqqD family protein of HPr-rel-A system
MVEAPGNDPRQRWQPLRKGDVWVRREGDQTAVYDPDTTRFHMLNPTALAIWEACDGETTVAEIIEAVIELTDAETARATEDVTRALQNLLDAGLLV